MLYFLQDLRAPSILKYEESSFVLSQTIVTLTKFIEKNIVIYHITEVYVYYKIIFIP
jgi:hypothetical protein